LFLRLSNCAPVGEKTLIIIKMLQQGVYVKNFDNYQDAAARGVREKL
jgi:hypothetical protein